MLTFPVSPAEFQERYFEREPALWRAVLTKGHAASLEDVDRLLERIELDEQRMQLINHGLVPQPSYTIDAVEFGERRRRLKKAMFYDQLRSGATLVLNRIESYEPQFKSLCTEVAQLAGLPTTSNAYLSFTGSGSFGKHWDTHDVFAIQLIGRKRWQVFEPTWLLPLPQHTSSSFGPHTGALRIDTVLEPGDVLYIPRGWWHEAIPLELASFHLSVGAYAPTVNDYLLWVANQWLPLQIQARRTFTQAGVATTELQTLFDAFVKAASDPRTHRQFAFELQRRERHVSSLDLETHVACAPLSESAIARMTASFLRDGERLLVNGDWYPLDPQASRVVDVLRDSAALRIDALHARIPNLPLNSLRSTILQLAARDIVSIEH